MRILLFANTSWYLFNFRGKLISALEGKGHTVFCLAPHDNYSEKLIQRGVSYRKINISQRGKNPFSEIIICIRLFLLFKKVRPDFILTFTIKCNLYAGFCRRLLSLKQIANISGLGEVFGKKGIMSLIVYFLYKYGLSGAERIFFQNEEDLNTLVHIKKCLPSEICTRIPGSGVDLSKFSPQPSSSDNNKIRRVFLMYGRMVPQKGYHLFLSAAEELYETYKGQIEFWILGIEDRSRKESIQLFERIKEYHDMGFIRYIPQTDDVPSVLHKVDVVVLPSQYNEGVPRTLLEAMACGKPLITTDWKGCRDTVENGVNGYLVRPGDLESLQQRITDLIHAPYEDLAKMGSASRRKAENEFDERIVIEHYLKEIEDKEY